MQGKRNSDHLDPPPSRSAPTSPMPAGSPPLSLVSLDDDNHGRDNDTKRHIIQECKSELSYISDRERTSTPIPHNGTLTPVPLMHLLNPGLEDVKTPVGFEGSPMALQDVSDVEDEPPRTISRLPTLPAEGLFQNFNSRLPFLRDEGMMSSSPLADYAATATADIARPATPPASTSPATTALHTPVPLAVAARAARAEILQIFDNLEAQIQSSASVTDRLVAASTAHAELLARCEDAETMRDELSSKIEAVDGDVMALEAALKNATEDLAAAQHREEAERTRADVAEAKVCALEERIEQAKAIFEHVAAA